MKKGRQAPVPVAARLAISAEISLTGDVQEGRSQVVKLTTSVRTSPKTETCEWGSHLGSLWPRLDGGSPIATVSMGKRQVSALIDSGSQVTTISERASRELFGEDQDISADMPESLRIWAENGLAVPYTGHFEADIRIGDVTVKRRGVLVVKEESKRAPCIVGMNVLSHVDQFRDVLPTQTEAIAYPEATTMGFARMAGLDAVVVPAQTYIDLTAHGVTRYGDSTAVLESLTGALPGGLIIVPSLVQGWRFIARLVNLSNKDVKL